MKKIIVIAIVALLIIGGLIGYDYYQRVWAVNTVMSEGEERVLFIPTGASYSEVLDSLVALEVLKDLEDFKWVADKKNYPSLVKSGRYVLEGPMTNNELANKLRSGDQDAVKLTLHNISGIYELAGKLGAKLESDSSSFLSLFKSEEALSAFGVEPRTVTAYFLPNTYEVWWNTSATAFLKRMRREFDRYWTPERSEKAEKQGLTPIEAITLASIVEKETVQSDEKPLVAGLYLNRLKKNMLLQSDPTAVYGYKLDYPAEKIRRVYNKHINYDSPFNTYLYQGLPPGPIKIPSLSTVEAVINPAEHDYIFMAADPDRPGYHNFATNLRQHNQNARKYRNWANRTGVR